jgi:hypothetical protein
MRRRRERSIAGKSDLDREQGIGSREAGNERLGTRGTRDQEDEGTGSGVAVSNRWGANFICCTAAVF